MVDCVSKQKQPGPREFFRASLLLEDSGRDRSLQRTSTEVDAKKKRKRRKRYESWAVGCCVKEFQSSNTVVSVHKIIFAGVTWDVAING